MSQLIARSTLLVPQMIAAARGRAQARFLEFFVSHIRNPNTCRAYSDAVGEFIVWREERGVPSLSRDLWRLR